MLKAGVGSGPPRLAVNKTEAAEALGVSVDFFDAHVAHELPCVRRGRRRLYSLSVLSRWLDEQSERVEYRCGIPSLLVIGHLVVLRWLS